MSALPGFHEIVLDLAAADGEPLPAILAEPRAGARQCVIVVVGGPQYRVGSHRQFVLLARALAARGIACLRFDYRGMGDAGGAPRDFEQAGPDIAVVVDQLQQARPEFRQLVLWGLCDGATAAAFHAARDARIDGLVLLNPWVRTSAGKSEAIVRHYYLQRLFSRDFWRKALGGGLRIGSSVRELLGHLRQARDAGQGASGASGGDLPVRLADSLARFHGRTLIILSENDLTADEYRAAAQRPPLDAAVRDLACVTVAGANHTFSSPAWRDAVAAHTVTFLRALTHLARYDRPMATSD